MCVCVCVCLCVCVCNLRIHKSADGCRHEAEDNDRDADDRPEQAPQHALHQAEDAQDCRGNLEAIDRRRPSQPPPVVASLFVTPAPPLPHIVPALQLFISSPSSQTPLRAARGPVRGGAAGCGGEQLPDTLIVYWTINDIHPIIVY